MSEVSEFEPKAFGDAGVWGLASSTDSGLRAVSFSC